MNASYVLFLTKKNLRHLETLWCDTLWKIFFVCACVAYIHVYSDFLQYLFWFCHNAAASNMLEITLNIIGIYFTLFFIQTTDRQTERALWISECIPCDCYSTLPVGSNLYICMEEKPKFIAVFKFIPKIWKAWCLYLWRFITGDEDVLWLKLLFYVHIHSIDT